ncbi:uncharacterized protein L969DRAFT_43152, partial [Mixia osmundae IAM 14324]|uniref:uncharacterized protein n=1 Tax=Mixia osmundae (strain CBS 9802 / IAM 14324 / JCM 22182 / KY 12970) TaxID=764103 RepID=UPI0004A55462
RSIARAIITSAVFSDLPDESLSEQSSSPLAFRANSSIARGGEDATISNADA